MEARELELKDNPRFSRREARFERLGYALIGFLVIGAAAGFFANGPLSNRTASAGSLELRYQRFARNQGRTTMEISVEAAADDGELAVAVRRGFLDAYEVEDIFPEPNSVRLTRDGVEYGFDAANDAVLEVIIRLRPDRPGRQRGLVSVHGDAVELTQFVYP